MASTPSTALPSSWLARPTAAKTRTNTTSTAKATPAGIRDPARGDATGRAGQKGSRGCGGAWVGSTPSNSEDTERP